MTLGAILWALQKTTETRSKEIAKRRDPILKRMHKLSHKSQKDYVGDSKKKGKAKKPKK